MLEEHNRVAQTAQQAPTQNSELLVVGYSMEEVLEAAGHTLPMRLLLQPALTAAVLVAAVRTWLLNALPQPACDRLDH